MSHALISPSGAARVIQCPGSPRMEQLFRGEEEQPEAIEGNVAHDHSAQCLKKPELLSGDSIPEEMHPHVEMYVRDVLDTIEMRRLSRDFLFVEHHVEIPSVHNDVQGTLDSAIYDPHTKTLIVWDFKYGWGVVDEWENWQGFWYALGLLRFYTDAEKVCIRIVQPRPNCPRGRIREWSFNPRGPLCAEMLARSVEAVRLAYTEAPPLQSGPECKYCAALLNCPAAENSAMLAVEAASKFYSTTVNAGRELVVLEVAEEILSRRITVLREKLETLIRTGRTVPGWGIAPVKGRTVWDVPAAQVLAIGELFETDLRKEAVVTPKQSKIPWDVIEPFTKTPRSMKLVRDDGRKIKQLLGE